MPECNFLYIFNWYIYIWENEHDNDRLLILNICGFWSVEILIGIFIFCESNKAFYIRISEL